jgi:alpha-L-arabinofuranosidase
VEHDNAPHRAGKIKIAVTEWNVTAGDWGTKRATLWTLDNALACARYHNLLHRHADLVTIANRSNLANSFCSGIIQTDRRGRLYKTPTYYAQQLYATLAGSIPLKIDSPSDMKLDCSATRSPDGHTLTLFVVNPTSAEIPTRIDATALGDLSGSILTHTLADRDRAGEPDVTNSFDDPARIIPVPAAINNESDNPFDYRFAPFSLTVLDISLLAP